jgi:hypothetical protein
VIYALRGTAAMIRIKVSIATVEKIIFVDKKGIPESVNQVRGFFICISGPLLCKEDVL